MSIQLFMFALGIFIALIIFTGTRLIYKFFENESYINMYRYQKKAKEYFLNNNQDYAENPDTYELVFCKWLDATTFNDYHMMYYIMKKTPEYLSNKQSLEDFKKLYITVMTNNNEADAERCSEFIKSFEEAIKKHEAHYRDIAMSKDNDTLNKMFCFRIS